MNIEHALATPGWISPEELAYLAEAASKRQLIVECGSWEGRSTLALAENTHGFVYAVDSWTGTMDDQGSLSVEVLHHFLRHTAHLNNIIPLPVDSMRACRLLNVMGVRPDLIFIDASHIYKDVVVDIEAWRSLLSLDGVLCGHDYGAPEHPGVKQAVDELIPKFRTIGSIWTTEEEQ